MLLQFNPKCNWLFRSGKLSSRVVAVSRLVMDLSRQLLVKSRRILVNGSLRMCKIGPMLSVRTLIASLLSSSNVLMILL